MNKAKLIKRFREYFSILLFFIMISTIFQNQMAFGSSLSKGKQIERCLPSACAKTDPRESLNKCRLDSYSPTYDKIEAYNKNGTTSGLSIVDGVVPLSCNRNVDLEFDPWQGPDYSYDDSNVFCLIFAISTALAYFALSMAASSMCSFPEIVGGTAATVAETGAKSTKIEKLKKAWDMLKQVKHVIKVVGGELVAAAGTAALTALTDPVIWLPMEMGIDTVIIGVKAAANAVALALSFGTDATAIKNLVTCGVAELLIITGFGILMGYAGIVYAVAQAEVNNAALCGNDWNGYAYTDPLKSGQFRSYPEFGSFPGSYSYAVKKCINNGECDSSILNDDEKACVLSEDGACSGIDLDTKNFKNRVYREFYYKGKEFTISKKKLFNDSNMETCIDPRLEIQKGFKGSEQRYYFRGTEGAQYACSRFKYGGGDCIINNKKESDSKKCTEAFQMAKECCENRRVLGACIYSTTDTLMSSGFSRPDRSDNAMCLRSYGNFGGELCNIGAVQYSAHAGKKDTTKICVQSHSLCPYNFNISGGTEVKDLFCDGNYLTCQQDQDTEGLYYQDNWNDRYKKDKQIICSDNVIGECKKPTMAYGNAKNFCSYNVHCTEVGQSDSFFVDIPENKFMPEVCSSFVGDSQFLPVQFSGEDGVIYDSKGLADFNNPVTGFFFKGTDFSLGNYRGFTAPIAQCIKETLDNMFHNVAGQTICNLEAEAIVNNYGYCGSDQTLEQAMERQKKNTGVDTPYAYIKGAPLDVEQNVFFRIQNLLKNIIRLVIILALVFIAISFMMKGDLDIFTDLKKPKALIFGFLKFAIVIYFALGNAWQTLFYDYITYSTTYAYNKIFQLSLVGYGDGTYISSPYQAVRLFDFGDKDDVKCNKNNFGQMVCTTNTSLGGVRRTLYNNYRLPLASPEEAKAKFSIGKEKVHCSTDKNGVIDCRYFSGGCDAACSSLANDDPNRTVYGKKLYIYSQKYDGCFFGDTSYPAGKAYLGIFDTLDCKLSSYMGYGPSIDLPGILQMLLVSLLFSPLLIMIVILGFMLFILLLSIAIKFIMMFLTCLIAINLLIYVSPIIFPLMLMKKTKGIFDKWLNNLMGFCFQFLFLCAFIGFFVGNIDKFGIGSARFVNHDVNGRLPRTSCNTTMIDAFQDLISMVESNSNVSNSIIFKDSSAYLLKDGKETLITINTSVDGLDENTANIIKQAQEVANSSSTRDSIICIFTVNPDIAETQPVLGDILYKYFGLGPIISGLGSIITFSPISQTATNAIEVGFTIVKFVLIMYVCLQLLKKLPEVSGGIFGGRKIDYKGDLGNPEQMMSKAVDIAKTGSGAAKGMIGKAYGTAGNAVEGGKKVLNNARASINDNKAKRAEAKGEKKDGGDSKPKSDTKPESDAK